MAIFMGNQVAVIAGTTTISTFVSSVSLSREIDPVEITTMSTSSSQQFHNFIGGLESSTLALELFNDFASASVNSLFEDAIGTKLAIKLIPVTGTVTATNPSYSMSCFIGSWQPINTTPDSPLTVSVTFPITALTKATS
jgi:hypothetical protein